MDTDSPPFDALLRRATSRARAGPLLEALGFAPEATPVPPAARAGFGLGDAADDVRGLATAGDRGGLAALLIETAGAATAERVLRIARRVRSHNPARPRLFIFAATGYRRLVFASFGLEGELRRLVVERRAPRHTDVETLREMVARADEGGVALALRHTRALDRSALGRRFFRDFKAERDRIAAAWTGVDRELRAEREQLALLLLSRLMFLYFLQRGGHLTGDARYVPHLFRTWRRRGEERTDGATFYRARLVPLFFGALNRRPEAREAAARALGPLPYLNGGLFERHALERAAPDLDLPDRVIAGVFDDLLERYRFTAREPAEAAADGAGEVGIDPEMLGRVFEGLMAPDRRGRTGTFYTPAPVVDRLVRDAVATYAAGRSGVGTERATALVRRGDACALEPGRRRALARALADVRVLDPACGSGAFLLAALSRLSRVRATLEDRDAHEFRREIVGRGLHGVDVQDDAALICALRLWLALAVEDGACEGSERRRWVSRRERGRGKGGRAPARHEYPGAVGTNVIASDRSGDPPPERRPSHPPAPLPNLDRKIRQGDALVDPLDLAAGGGAPEAWNGAAADAGVRHAIREIEPLAVQYPSAEPDAKPGLQKQLSRAEAGLARAWLDALGRRFSARLAELRAETESRDLFGDRPAAALRAEAARERLEEREAERARLRTELDDAGALPFFSWPVHFPEAAERGFDLILSNPPWVRAHRWPESAGTLVRQRYAVCRTGGWRRGAELAGAPGGVGAQVDLSLLFLERSLRLLAPGGVLAMLLPAKALRSLYGAGARRLLLRTSRVVAVEDHSLDQRSIFRADAFAATLVAEKRGTAETDGSATSSPTGVRITMVRRGVEPLRFAVPRDGLPVVPGDVDAPWLFAPPAARAALRRMQAAGPPLGDREALRVRRGVMTGANDVLVAREAEPKLGGLAWMRAEGFFRARRGGRPDTDVRSYEALVEAEALRPLVRGSGISAWRYETGGHVLWVHDDATTKPLAAPPRRAGRYLDRHTERLRARSGWRAGRPEGAIFRLRPDTLGPKVAWHDLADTLKAVALPARVRGLDGRPRALIPLNTVYFIPVEGEDDALLLAAYLNSLPVRTFARAVAERAKDARFRFLAWTVALLPLPERWNASETATRLLALARAAHRRGVITPDEQLELDALVAGAYALGPADREALARFDRWLRGDGSS